MLVKFDHLTYAANRASVQTIVKDLQRKGYQLTLQEEQAANMSTKLAYMQFKDATHGLHFLAPPAEGGIPVEIVSYENTTDGDCCINYEAGKQSFVIKTADVDSCKTVLLAIGCEEQENGVITFQGAFDDFPIEISIEHVTSVATNLDNEGVCCPTVFVKPLGKTKKKIEEAGIHCSEIETFEVQGTSLYVFFAQGKGGEIIEITSNKL